VLRTGVDLIEIERLQEVVQRHGQRFLQRVFTARELGEAGQNLASLAARFAAKEAVSKALGTGIGTIGWLEIEITHGPVRQPVLHLNGEAARLASDLGLREWSVSLSHTPAHAIALVVATGGQPDLA